MAFSYKNSKGTTYYLHQRETTLKNGTKQNIFFFAKEPKDGVLEAIPTGYEASESRNGLPVLRKVGGGKSSSSKSAKAASKPAAKKTSKAASKPAAKKTSKK